MSERSLRQTIILTAGHSDRQSGAVSPDGKFREADFCERLRDAVAERLRHAGCVVITDGALGVNLSLREAITLARNHSGPELELHLNAGGGTGVEAFSLLPQRPFAQALAQAVARVLDLPLRGRYYGWKSPSESQHGSLGICNAGAVLLEVAFIDNSRDMARLVERFDQVAEVLARVLMEWAQDRGPQIHRNIPNPKPPRLTANPPSTPSVIAAPLPTVQAAHRDAAPNVGAWPVTAPPARSAELPRPDSRKSLWTVIQLALAQFIATVAGWWQNVDRRLLYVGLMIGLTLIGLAYLYRQMRLGVAREMALISRETGLDSRGTGK